MIHRAIFALLFGAALMLSPAKALRAQTAPVWDDEVKINIYKKFVENREPNPAIAYQAARDYMARYGREDDQYTRYLKQWIAAFEKDERQDKLLHSIYTEKNYAAGFGLAKQVLVDDPENLKALIALGYGGYLATTTARNESFNADSIRYTQKAIQLLEAGKTPDVWEPFKNKDDVLASLRYAIGYLELKTRPEEAIGQFIRVAQLDSDLKKAPSTYFGLAQAYEHGPYQRLSADYKKRFENQPESSESKAALDTLNKVIDKIIDAYARAIALSGDDPKHQVSKAEWLKHVTQLYKFRHDNSDVGLKEFLGGVLAKPLPQ